MPLHCWWFERIWAHDWHLLPRIGLLPALSLCVCKWSLSCLCIDCTGDVCGTFEWLPLSLASGCAEKFWQLQIGPFMPLHCWWFKLSCLCIAIVCGEFGQSVEGLVKSRPALLSLKWSLSCLCIRGVGDETWLLIGQWLCWAETWGSRIEPYMPLHCCWFERIYLGMWLISVFLDCASASIEPAVFANEAYHSSALIAVKNQPVLLSLKWSLSCLCICGVGDETLLLIGQWLCWAETWGLRIEPFMPLHCWWFERIWAHDWHLLPWIGLLATLSLRCLQMKPSIPLHWWRWWCMWQLWMIAVVIGQWLCWKVLGAANWAFHASALLVV